MNILTIPLRNCRRRWTRTLLLLVVFAAGVASIVALTSVSKVVGHSLEKKLTAFGANILVAPRKEALAVSYGGFHLGEMVFEAPHLPEADTVARIASIKNRGNLAAVAPKLVAMSSHSSGPVGVVGVRWEQEKSIKSYWELTGSHPDAPDQVVLGDAAARRLGAQVGARVTLFGADLRVAGVLAPTGSDDDGVAFMDIAELQRLSGRPDQASFVEVAALCAGCPIDDIVAQISEKLPGADIKALRSVIEARMFSIRFMQRLILGVSVVILFTACAMIGLSMLSAVNERRKEIGILRSLGYSRGGVFLIFSAEALFIGALAGLAGHAAGYGLSLQVLAVLDMLDGRHGLPFSAAEMLAAGGAFGLLAMLAAAFPAVRAARVDPVEALIAL